MIPITTSSASVCPAVPCSSQARALDWRHLKLSAEQLLSRDAAAAKVESLLPGSSTAHCVFGVDLCWNEFTCDSLVVALATFAAVAGPALPALNEGSKGELEGLRVVYSHWNRSTRVTRYLLSQLKEHGCVARILHPPDWLPQPGSSFHGLVAPAISLAIPSPGLICGEEVSSSREAAPLDDDDDSCCHMDEVFGEMNNPAADQMPAFFVFEILQEPPCNDLHTVVSTALHIQPGEIT